MTIEQQQNLSKYLYDISKIIFATISIRPIDYTYQLQDLDYNQWRYSCNYNPLLSISFRWMEKRKMTVLGIIFIVISIIGIIGISYILTHKHVSQQPGILSESVLSLTLSSNSSLFSLHVLHSLNFQAQRGFER